MESAKILVAAMLFAPLLCTAGCGTREQTGNAPSSPQAETPATPERSLEERAAALTREALVVDTHIDVPYRLLEKTEDISGPTEGDFDYAKAIEGGLDAAFMSIYVPASLQEEGGAYEHAEMLIDMVEGFAERWPEKFAIVTSPAEIREHAAEAGLVSLALGMENGAPVGDLEDLRHFYERGIRYITLTHSEDNRLSDSSYAETATWGGLSDFGREVVAEMNRLGIMVDVSHLSDEAFWDVLEVSHAPVIASHSSCRHFTPDFERNMSDEMIQALAEQGGVIQINFGSSFITAEANAYFETYDQARDRYLAETGVGEESEEATAWRETYREEHAFPFADVSDVADHIQHVVQLTGVEHVGLGSDFDGVGDSLPVGLKDASDLPNLVAELLGQGLTERDVRLVLSGNLLRVWEEVEQIAQQAAGRSSDSRSDGDE